MALICYNRPDLVRRVVSAVREAAPEELFVVADGPRVGDAEDARRCAQVRAALEDEIDWPCTVRRRYAEKNSGVEQTVELGLDWVFEQVDRAVVLEDDCVPDPTFFRFCAELLDRHADDERVMMVSGQMFVIDPSRFAGASYAFTTFSITWGWATWSRAWQRHRGLFPRDYETVFPGADSVDAAWRVEPARPTGNSLVTRAGGRYFAEVAAAKEHEFGWDSQWFLTQVALDALAITPAINLVHNAGFGEDATHTVSTRTLPPAEKMRFPLRHPVEGARNVDAQHDLEVGIVRSNGRLARRLRRLTPQGRLRTVGRVLADRLVRSRRA
ncbi:hypothetical protein [Nocardioides terrisoli]|uniref:hypothetical protein n=1 Tax=Nocardioides terrisoli TaxID=3388267 RepID=UPI00287BB450|nr:hypothetical protein [Nocardioides marmorisolisilvae]